MELRGPSLSDSPKQMEEFLSLGSSERLTALEELALGVEGTSLMKFELGQHSDTKSAIAQDLVAVVRRLGLGSPEGKKVLSIMRGQVLSTTATREGGYLLLLKLLNNLQKAAMPAATPLLEKVLLIHGDRSPLIRELAVKIRQAITRELPAGALRLVIPAIIAGMESEDWRVRVGALDMLRVVGPRAINQMSPLLPKLIAPATECIISTKKEVKAAGLVAMTEACKCITNDDILPLVPQLVNVIAKPEDAPKLIDKLLETVFVAQVDAPTMALIAPLLNKAFKTRNSVISRKASKIIESMVKLVEEPKDVEPFVPQLLPGLERVIDEVTDMEVCEVAKSARSELLAALQRSRREGPDATKLRGLQTVATRDSVMEALCGHVGCAKDDAAEFVAELFTSLIIFGHPSGSSVLPDMNDSQTLWQCGVSISPIGEWADCLAPFLPALSVTDAVPSLSEEGCTKLAYSFREACLNGMRDMMVEEEVDDANLLCNFEFSLAFGGKILLHNTTLKLIRGRHYGIMGKNGAGKTTLLTNIGSGNIEGLPVVLKTVYVQHDEASEGSDTPLLDDVVAVPHVASAGVTREETEAALKAINFTDAMLTAPRSSLSGGWKMKALIIQAMLSRADVLLLDEPTNHLDAASVQWLIKYLRSQTQVTCMIVSHDTGFLDGTISDVIHYESKKLVYYHGNLTDFVKVKPEAKYYYQLDSSLVFTFPTPERLDGVNSTTRAILKMDNVTYTYPGRDRPTIMDATVKVSLGSRVAVLGPNGAGKSTLIKMMVAETEPDTLEDGSKGEVWKHPNLRLAYVAQHSFHHVEEHLESSPVDYFKWRFYGGVDREEFLKANQKMTEEEEEVVKQKTGYGDVKEVIGRRKHGRTMEYECTWYGMVPQKDTNKYIAMDKLIEMGLGKLVKQCDTRIASAAAGLDVRPLLNKEIQGHLDQFNLEAEFGTHSKIKRLSGGQKVKLVLASAMWNRPHILVLDEPTNYLDREALGALTKAIKDFGGGVVIISHNKEFTDALCSETWTVGAGRCTVEGEAADSDLKASSSRRKKESSSGDLKRMGVVESAKTGESVGNVNGTILSESLINPKTYEKLSKKEVRKLEKCAAGVPLKEYLSKINKHSPEWKWLGQG
jgi:elongation factor 3